MKLPKIKLSIDKVRPYVSTVVPFLKSRDVIGLDIGSNSIKLVELKRTKDSYQLKNISHMPVPPESIVDGAFINSSQVVEIIKDFISTANIKTKQVATSISGHSVIIKRISLPSMSRVELEDSIQWEAEQYIPFDINDVNLDFQILGANVEDPGQMNVLLVAAKKDIINDHTAVILEAGLIPAIIDIDAFAVENAFELNYGVGEHGTIALINIGSSIINIVIIKNAIPVFTRDISAGGKQYTEEIQRLLNLSFNDAEALKVKLSKEEAPSKELLDSINNISSSLSGEVQRSLDFYSATSGEEGAISKVYFCGGATKIPGLDKAIEEKIGQPFEILNPFKNIDISSYSGDIEYVNDMAHTMGVAVGLALRKVNDK